MFAGSGKTHIAVELAGVMLQRNQHAKVVFLAPTVALAEQQAGTVNSLCSDCFGYQEICPYIDLSLLRGTNAVRMQ